MSDDPATTPEERAPTPDAAGTGVPILETQGLTKIFGGLTAVSEVSFAVPGADDRLDHRAQRRRQDDVLQHAHRPLQAEPRPGGVPR